MAWRASVGRSLVGSDVNHVKTRVCTASSPSSASGTTLGHLPLVNSLDVPRGEVTCGTHYYEMCTFWTVTDEKPGSDQVRNVRNQGPWRGGPLSCSRRTSGPRRDYPGSLADGVPQGGVHLPGTAGGYWATTAYSYLKHGHWDTEHGQTDRSDTGPPRSTTDCSPSCTQWFRYRSEHN